MNNDISEIVNIIENNKEIYSMLKHCPYEILKEWRICKYKRHQVIITQGEIFNKFGILVDGQLNIYMMAENGRKYSQALYKKGNYIGELEIFDNKPSSCFVEALSDAVLIELDRNNFLKWFELDKNISSYITKTLCSLFYTLSQKSGRDALYSLKQRICSYLIECSKRNMKQNGEIKVYIKKNILGEQMGVTQRSINRILKYLKNKNIIEEQNNKIIIKDYYALKKEERNDKC